MPTTLRDAAAACETAGMPNIALSLRQAASLIESQEALLTLQRISIEQFSKANNFHQDRIERLLGTLRELRSIAIDIEDGTGGWPVLRDALLSPKWESAA